MYAEKEGFARKASEIVAQMSLEEMENQGYIGSNSRNEDLLLGIFSLRMAG